MDDETLLRRFATSKSEDAFRALVQRHVGMVLGVAHRRTGSRSLAEEIAQNVFTILAQKAGRLKARPALGGWLYRTTLLECASAHRRNHAHARKMNAYSQHVLSSATGRSVWQDALPVLDEAIDALPAADRELILLRFFERRSFREIGVALGKSEAAAQKHGERALQKLSAVLRRKGVIITAAMLASGMGAQGAQATPATLVQTVSEAALFSASNLSAKVLILQTLEAMTSTKLKTVVAAALVAAVPLTVQWAANHDLRDQLARLRQQLAEARAAKPSDAVKRPSLVFALPRAARPGEMAAARPPFSSPVPAVSAATPADWERALLDPDPLRRARRMAELLAALTADQAPVVAEVFGQIHGLGRGFVEEYNLFLRAWGSLDGEAAVQHASTGQPGAEEALHLNAAVAGWASRAPHAARAWVEALPDGDRKEELVLGLLDGWSMADFASAAAYAESRPRSEARNQFRQLLLQRALGAGGVAAAQQWFSRIPDDEHNSLYKQRAFGEVIQTMLYRDPSAAAHWISQLGGKPFVTGDTVAQTAAKLAENSPAQAMQWLQTLKGLAQEHVAAGQTKVMETWARQDANAAGLWLEQNRGQAGYDPLAGSYARAIGRSYPQTALAWAQTMGDEAERDAVRLAIAGDYLRRDGEQAERQLLAAGFTAEMIAQAKARFRGETAIALWAQAGGTEARLDLSDALVGHREGAWHNYWTRKAAPAEWINDGADRFSGSPHGSKYPGMNCAQCHGGNGAQGGQTSIQSDKVVLLRRMYLDTAGVLPTAVEALAFSDETASVSYDRLVDYLLISRTGDEATK